MQRYRALPVSLGVLTLGLVVVLLVRDAFPGAFPVRAHDVLGALPLGLIALAYLSCQWTRRPAPAELVKAAFLALAFLLWAANQLWPERPAATLLNDLAIALFVLDVFLVMVGWPRSSEGASFAETHPREARTPSTTYSAPEELP
jgi:hypothetical protein